MASFFQAVAGMFAGTQASQMTAQEGADVFAKGRQLADLFGGIIDEPIGTTYSNPTYTQDPRFPEVSRALAQITGYPFQAGGAFNPQQFGETQNPPQYRGIRLLLPGSGGEYESAFQEGRIPGWNLLQQAFLGEMIRRGYPLLGGTGAMPGFEQGFNPIGFGSR